MLNNKQKTILGIITISLVLLVIGVTYAFFTADITGRETTSTIIVNGEKTTTITNQMMGGGMGPRMGGRR